MKIVKKTTWFEHDGSRFEFRPRNIKATELVRSLNTDDFIGLLRVSLVGWENVQDEDGNEVPFSEENINYIATDDAVAITKLYIDRFYGDIESDQGEEKN